MGDGLIFPFLKIEKAKNIEYKVITQFFIFYIFLDLIEKCVSKFLQKKIYIKMSQTETSPKGQKRQKGKNESVPKIP